MENLREIHDLLLEGHQSKLQRSLMSAIDWNHRFICIKGFRGVGKSDFLLEFVSKYYKGDNTCLYVDLNNFYFSKRKIYNFADDFYKKGGKVLVLDQIQKYPDWIDELVRCHSDFPELKIIFSSSPVLRVWDADARLKDIVAIYHLKGLSFREFLNYKTDSEFRSYSFEEIVKNHREIAKSITKHVMPLAYFDQYLINGYYPYSIDSQLNECSVLLKHINLALEIDVTSLNQIELKYLPKLRKLLRIICNQAPFTPNISKLSADVETSRATIINYLRYLKNARLINLVYADSEEEMQKKPSCVYAHNTNILYAVSPENFSTETIRKTFFFNQVSSTNIITSSSEGDFVVDGKYDFTIGGKYHEAKSLASYAAVGRIEVGKGNKIPLWLFGFLY
ncbi:MAG: AAA family ATPase [Mangrovibacterium sp.]